MPRKRTEIAPAVEAEIRARFERGETAETVLAAMGLGISLSTLKRRHQEYRGKPASSPMRVAPAVEPQPSAEDVPDAVPDGTPLEQIDAWIKRLNAAAAKAEAQGNLSALASLAAKVQSLMTLRHKSQPLAKVDHNENPDLKALAAEGRETLGKLLHDLFAPAQ